MPRRVVMLQLLVLVATFSVAQQAAALCNMPLEVRVAAKDEWEVDVAGITMAGPHYSDNSALSRDAIPATAFDRVQNFTLWVGAGQTTLKFTVKSYANVSTTTGLMASVWFAGSLLTQTGQAGWSVSSITDATWRNAANCSQAPATVNAYGQSFADFITSATATPVRPAWIAPGGVCATASVTTYYVRVQVTMPAYDAKLCPPANSTDSIMTLANPMLSYTIGARTANTQPLMVRITADNDYVLYLANYTVLGPREDDYSTPYGWQRITDLRMNVVPGKYVFAVRVTDYGSLRGFITSILYQNSVFAMSDGLAQWKITNNASLARAGWNTDYNFDASGWHDVDTSLTCANQDPWGDVQKIVSGLGGCPQWMFYPNCISDAVSTQAYIRFAFDLNSGVFNRPQIPCRDSASSVCPAGSYPNSNGLACLECPAGTYKPLAGNGRCLTCPARMTTTAAKSSACVCAANYELRKVDAVCTPCAAGTYKDTAGNSTCLPCPANAACSGTSPFVCGAGYTVSADGTSCVKCAIGTYKITVGNGACVPCPPGMSTLSPASAAPTMCQCDIDYGRNGTVCTKCLQGTRKIYVGDTGCVDCRNDTTDARCVISTPPICSDDGPLNADGRCADGSLPPGSRPSTTTALTAVETAQRTADVVGTDAALINQPQQPANSDQPSGSTTVIAIATGLCAAALIAAAVALVVRRRRITVAGNPFSGSSGSLGGATQGENPMFVGRYATHENPIFNSSAALNRSTDALVPMENM